MSFIKKIRIKNFKNLEDVEIDVKPLTFLFGPNGSGKSSFIKAMMFLQKNLFPLNTGKTIYKISDDVDLGSYKDIVINGDFNKNIVFEFDFVSEYEFPSTYWITEDELDEDDISEINLAESMLEESELDQQLRHIKYVKSNNFFKAMSRIDEETNVFSFHDLNEREKYFNIIKYNFTYKIEFADSSINYNFCRLIINDNINNSKYEFVGNLEYKDQRISKEEFNFHNNIDLSELFNQNMHLRQNNNVSLENKDNKYFEVFEQCFQLSTLSPLNEVLSDWFSRESLISGNHYSKEWDTLNMDEKTNFYFEVLKFCYLSNNFIPFHLNLFFQSKHIPLIRQPPKQKYLLDRNEFNENEYYGFLKILDLKSSENKNEFINTIIKKMELGFQIIINKKHDVGSILLKDKFNKSINIANSSSGFIQVFPIIILSCNLYKIKDSDKTLDFHIYNNNHNWLNYFTLFIEQPELHLHPKLQSKLAELFSDTIKDSDNNLFIETHSEHLIRKIQVLIAKGEIYHEKVGVWYFDNSEGTTKIKQMEINENGLFKEDWPKGFFDDSINLTMELFEAIRKRKN